MYEIILIICLVIGWIAGTRHLRRVQDGEEPGIPADEAQANYFLGDRPGPG